MQPLKEMTFPLLEVNSRVPYPCLIPLSLKINSNSASSYWKAYLHSLKD
jgi:hypothetical protein